MEIFIANLPYHIKTDEVAYWFGQFGRVQSAKIIADKNTRRSHILSANCTIQFKLTPLL